MRLGLFSIGLVVSLGLQEITFAAEPKFGITAEFLSVCDNFSSSDKAAQNLLEANWSEEGKQFRDTLSPDDLLKKVKNVRAFSVELENGGKWLAATANARMGKAKVAYCAVVAIDNDPDGYRQDFELASELKQTDSVQIKNEDLKLSEERFIYQVSDSKTYIMREVRASENGLFTYIRLAPLSAKGK